MPVVLPDLRLGVRGARWRWWVCCLLLLATMINYMDRLTLNQLQIPLEKDLQLTEDVHYSWLEAGFGLAFAVGAVVFGFLVDRWNVFWVYPLALLGWSLAGFCTGFAQGFLTLLLCRVCLGLVEAANWPCALRTTQRILPPSERSLGNSILQSGAAVGAIIVPLLLLALFDQDRPQTWRTPFLVVGAVGSVWVALWWFSVRRADLALPPPEGPEQATQPGKPDLPRAVFLRRFLVLVVLVVTINMTWHFLRAWHPKFLQKIHGFTPRQTFLFSSVYYAFTDVGALTAGFASLWLARRGAAVHASRRLVFLAGAVLASLCLAVPFIDTPWLLVGMLFVVGFGALGVFPCYYSFSQDLTTRSQGKVTGVLGACCWGAMFLWQLAIGQLVSRTHSYLVPFLIAGLGPLVGFAALLLLWGPVEEPAQPARPAVDSPAPPGETRLEPGEIRVAAARLETEGSPT
jgi:ACS family hexuronate transporter-like MFS transporter